MKATDLMIGDWVQNACGNPIQIGEILEDGINGVWDGGEWCDFYDDIKPIPIDLDILEKMNGKEVQGKIYASIRRTHSPKRMMDGLCIIMRRELQKSALSTNCRT